MSITEQVKTNLEHGKKLVKEKLASEDDERRTQDEVQKFKV